MHLIAPKQEGKYQVGATTKTMQTAVGKQQCFAEAEGLRLQDVAWELRQHIRLLA